MKFGKSLSNQIEGTLPEWRDKFLSYKELKKRLKLIEPKKGSLSSLSAVDKGDEIRAGKKPKLDCSTGGGGSGAEKAEMTEAEVDFVRLLEDELEKFNTFFVEKEEEYIIRLKELQDRVAKVKDYTDEMIKIRKEIVDFHGEMVLLENYSALNYTGLVKILKKYDKRTGALLRLPFIEKVLQQPFFTIDLLYKLVKECERMLDHLFLLKEVPSATTTTTAAAAERNESTVRGQKEVAQIEDKESLYMKSSLSALRALKEIRSGSSTVSVFSLPPLQVGGGGLDEPWNKVPILEQVAK